MTNMDFIMMALRRGHWEVDCEEGIIYKTIRNKGEPYTPYKNKQGYLSICSRIKGITKDCRIHRIVWMSKHGRIPKGLQVNHKDCNKTNNRIRNLELCTPLENIRHGIKNGRANTSRGEKHCCAKLTEKDVRKIRKFHSQGKYKQVELARMYNVDPSAIWRVLHRKAWAHI